MLRKFLIIGLILISAGTAALVLLGRHEAKWRQFSNTCRSRYAVPMGDYIQQYTEWLKLPERRRTTQPWENSGNDITAATIRRKQYERFVADIEKLDSLEPHLYPMARLLYGSDWRNRLRDYKLKRELEKAGLAGAIISCCLGGAFVATTFAGAGVNRLKRKKAQDTPVSEANGVKTQNQPEKTPEHETHKDTDRNKKNLAAILNCYHYSTTEPVENEKQKQKDTANKTAKKQTGGETGRGLKEAGGGAQPADTVKQQPRILHDTLNRLTDEVAAIRHYAGQQQEKVKKLQEGYDWNIIRNFALRIIRCIDNLEMRIDAAGRAGGDTADLEEIRDELIFALESSGLQRYEPQVNSDYRGQEKTAQAVKDKKSANAPALRGKIADVVRCGYRYFVDEESFKVVRTAQVRLFG